MNKLIATTDATAGKTSRLPAGSTLMLPNGIHVPHPHAEVNLAGAGDPRLGDTAAVTERVQRTVAHNEQGDEVVTLELKQDPLHDEVKPKTLTSAL